MGNPPVTDKNSPHKGPVMRKACPYDDVTMIMITFMGTGCQWRAIIRGSRFFHMHALLIDAGRRVCNISCYVQLPLVISMKYNTERLQNNSIISRMYMHVLGPHGRGKDISWEQLSSPRYFGKTTLSYSISQEICTRFCCAVLCCGYAIVHKEFTWSIYPYSSGLLCWHWGNR